MNWAEISIQTREEWAEAVADAFYGVGVNGVIIEDSMLVHQYIASNQWDYYDQGLVESTFDGIIVKGYLPSDEQLPSKLEQLQALLLDQLTGQGWQGELPPVTMIEVDEDDWANSWKAYYKPIQIGERVIIKPHWEEYIPKEGETVITLDPGMAFGTGTHASTSMCLVNVERYLQPGDQVLDLGTGSGILAIAAAKLGSGTVLAIDLDPVAVEVAQSNVLDNGQQDKITVKQGNLVDAVEEQVDLVVANIIAKVIIDLIPQLSTVVRPGGMFIAGGIILEREEEVIKQLELFGYELIHVEKEGEWVCVVSRRPKQ